VKELIPGDIERYHISHLEWVEKGGDLRRGRALDSKEPSVELLQALHAYQQALVLAADPKDRERLDAKVGMVLQLQEAWHNESLRRQELGIMVQEAELLKLEKELTAEKLAALKQQGVEVARLRAEVERLREDDRRIARAFDEISQAVIALEEDIDDLRGFDRVFVTINDFGDLRSDLENLERQVRRLQARVSRSD
jgi:hypothetical protein